MREHGFCHASPFPPPRLCKPSWRSRKTLQTLARLRNDPRALSFCGACRQLLNCAHGDSRQSESAPDPFEAERTAMKWLRRNALSGLSACAEPLIPLHGLGNRVVNFLYLQLRKHRQREALGCIELAVRHLGSCVSRLAPRITLLLVNGYGIVHLHVNAGVTQELLQVVAFWVLDDVEVEDMPVA